jgi:hypothetical protein
MAMWVMHVSKGPCGRGNPAHVCKTQSGMFKISQGPDPPMMSRTSVVSGYDLLKISGQSGASSPAPLRCPLSILTLAYS